MFRKSWLILLILVLAVTMLAACGGSATPTAAPEPTEAPAAAAPTDTPVPEPTEAPAQPEPTDTPEAAPEPTAEPEEAVAELTIWADKERVAALQPLSEAFQAEYGVKLNITEVGFGDIRDQVKLAAPAGEGPDLFVGAHDWLGELYTNGIVAPIDLGNKEASFFGPAIEAFTYDGQLVGMPYATENLGFLYNPDLVSEAPTTWDQVIEIAAKLEDEGKVKQGWVLMPGDAYHFYPLQTAFGGYIFGTTDGGYDPTDVGLDNEGSIAALTFVDEAVKAGHLSADVDWETAHVLFENGDAAMIATGPWALERFRAAGIPYVIAPLPGETEEGRPFLGVQGFMINDFSENKLLAEAFLTEFVASDEAMQAIFDADPRPSAWMPVRDAIDDPDIAAFAAAGVSGAPMPAIPEMSAVWGAWGDAITLVFQQASTPEEAAKNAAEQVRAAIAGE